MVTARLLKRVFGYLINFILYVGLGFGCAGLLTIPFELHILLFFFYAALFSLAIALIFNTIIILITKGYTVGNSIFGVKYVSNNGLNITFKQSLIRSFAESTLIFALLDLFYISKYRTERGVIDRLSDSFAIDIRL